jgi:hypothetical protein
MAFRAKAALGNKHLDHFFTISNRGGLASEAPETSIIQ